MAAAKKVKSTSKPKTGRPKPLVHTPGLTKTRRRFGCGGHMSTKKSS